MTRRTRRQALVLLGFFVATAACAPAPIEATPDATPLYPNETPELRLLINQYADLYEVPRPLVHRVVVRESTHQPEALNRPYYGLMQILPATARSMGFQGQPTDLLDPETNLKYAVRYLRGAWLLSDGSYDNAVKHYSRGYYFEAKKRGMLVETGLVN
jgi:soluble lytic murein transglycosylase-like protein